MDYKALKYSLLGYIKFTKINEFKDYISSMYTTFILGQKYNYLQEVHSNEGELKKSLSHL